MLTEFVNLTYAVNDNSSERELFAKCFVEAYQKEISPCRFNLVYMALKKGNEQNVWWDENEYSKELYLIYLKKYRGGNSK